MKHILVSILSILLLGAPLAYGQTVQATHKPTKKERRIAEKRQLMKVINSGRYVLEAHTLHDRYGNSYPLNPSINFVMVDGKKSVIQLGNDYGVGLNGLGGVTFEGSITDLDILEGKPHQGPGLLIKSIGSPLGFADINLTVNTDGYARATIHGSFGRRFTLSGRLVPLEDSRVFKGQTTYF
ncbi:MAG: DUF4251 domain-containing protein [Bacteroidetes bacterium]|nr:MAG: DUF4251 domain-containing protein [Bacteroidota bacterium]